MKEEKKLNLPQSLLLLVLIIFSVAVCIRLKTGGPMIGLFASWIFIYLVCKIVRIPYDNVVAGAYDAIRIQDNRKNLAAEMAWRDEAILDEIREAGYEGYVVNGKDLDVF